jgi:hypothetical protein
MEPQVQTEENSSQAEKPQIDVEELVNTLASKVEQLESSNARLLDESKGWKDKYQGLKGKHEKENEIKLTENEQWKELVEIERNKRFDLESRVKDLTTLSMQKDLQYKVASLAKDAHNVEDVVTAVSRSGLLEMDKETGSIRGIEEAYNKVREDKPYFFNTAKKSGMSAGKPDTMVPQEKTIDERIDENPNEILASVLKDLI